MIPTLAGTERSARQQAIMKTAPLLSAAVGFALIICFLLVNGALSVNKRELALALIATLLVPMVSVAVTKPFIFPLGLFAALVPFDNILRINSFGTLTKLLGLCSGVALVFWLIRNRRYVKPSAGALLSITVLIWMALSVLWAMNSDDATGKMITYVQLVGLYVVISIAPLGASEFKAFLSCVVAGSLAAALFAIYQFHSGGPMVEQSMIGAQEASRVFVRVDDQSTINPNAFGAALLLPIAIVMMSVLQRKWGFQKLALVGALLVLLSGVYVTGSRGAVVAVGVILLYLLFRSRYKSQVLLFLSVALVAGLTHASSLSARFSDAVSTGGAGRLRIWAVGWDALKRHWLLGAGVGNFVDAYQKSFINVFQTRPDWVQASHNSFLTLAVELGILGLLLVVVACVAQWRTLRLIGKTDPMYDIRIALEGAMLGLFVAALFLELTTNKYTWLLFETVAAARAYALCRNPVPRTQFPIKTIDPESFRQQSKLRMEVNNA
jgi:hypothetical protein